MFRRLAWIGFGFSVVAAATFFYSMNGDCQDRVGPNDLGEGEPIIKQSTDLIVVEPAPATVDIYLDLVRQKIELLTVEELAVETVKLRKELAELQATRKLRDAEQQLEQLIDQFRGTSAAERARAMLGAGRKHKATLLAPTPDPKPKPQFEDPFNERRS